MAKTEKEDVSHSANMEGRRGWAGHGGTCRLEKGTESWEWKPPNQNDI